LVISVGARSFISFPPVYAGPSADRGRPGDQFVQAFIAFTDSGFHATLQHAVPILDGLKNRDYLQARSTFILLESQRIKRNVTRRTFELEGLDDTVRRWSSVEYAMKPVLGTVGVPMNVALDAPILNVVAFDLHGQPAWAEPLHEQIGIDVRPEEQVTRGSEFPGNRDLLASWFGDDLGRSHDWLLSAGRLRQYRVAKRQCVSWSGRSS